jgi:hypothetical protein
VVAHLRGEHHSTAEFPCLPDQLVQDIVCPIRPAEAKDLRFVYDDEQTALAIVGWLNDDRTA